METLSVMSPLILLYIFPLHLPAVALNVSASQASCRDRVIAVKIFGLLVECVSESDAGSVKQMKEPMARPDEHPEVDAVHAMVVQSKQA